MKSDIITDVLDRIHERLVTFNELNLISSKLGCQLGDAYTIDRIKDWELRMIRLRHQLYSYQRCLWAEGDTFTEVTHNSFVKFNTLLEKIEDVFQEIEGHLRFREFR